MNTTNTTISPKFKFPYCAMVKHTAQFSPVSTIVMRLTGNILLFGIWTTVFEIFIIKWAAKTICMISIKAGIKWKLCRACILQPIPPFWLHLVWRWVHASDGIQQWRSLFALTSSMICSTQLSFWRWVVLSGNLRLAARMRFSRTDSSS